MKALPKDQQYPAILRSGRGPHSEVQRRNSDTMWLLIIACGIVLTMWVVDELRPVEIQRELMTAAAR